MHYIWREDIKMILKFENIELVQRNFVVYELEKA